MIHKLVEIPTEVVNEYYIVNWTKVRIFLLYRPWRSCVQLNNEHQAGRDGGCKHKCHQG